MSNTTLDFPLFSELPPELRQWIWRLCLPRRACQLDLLAPDNLYMDEPYPCQLQHTNIRNSSPPAISRICRESRSVALKAGGISSEEDRPANIRWDALRVSSPWLDRNRDLIHLNWNPVAEAMYNFGHGHPIQYLSWKLRREGSFVGSITLDFLMYQLRDPYVLPTFDPDTQDWLWANISRPSHSIYTSGLMPGDLVDLEALLSIPSCFVVMRTIVVHKDLRAAASTGLFGFLGDAPIQIIDAREEALVEELWCLAETSEKELLDANKQDLVRVTADGLNQELKDVVMERYQSEELVSMLHPATMFRLCTQMCKGPKLSDEEIRLSRMTEEEIAECRNPDGQLMPYCRLCTRFHNPRSLPE